MSMWQPILAIIIGLGALVWSADRFVIGAASTAKHLGMSPLLIGLTIVAFGTSAPEIVVSAIASYQGNGGLAIGNAVGSNITNIALILGITALIKPLFVDSSLMHREIPLLILVNIIAIWCLRDLELGFVDSIVLFGVLIISQFLFIHFALKKPSPENSDVEEIHDYSLLVSIAWLVFGLACLIISSKALVWGAIEVASALGVSEVIIGLTIVAIGTSLPELAASMASALRGHHDMAIGAIIGSNTFNLLAVMPIPGLFSPTTIDQTVFYRDLGAMFGVTILLVLMMWIRRNQQTKLGRGRGFLQLCSYFAYMGCLYFMTAHHI